MILFCRLHHPKNLPQPSKLVVVTRVFTYDTGGAGRRKLLDLALFDSSVVARTLTVTQEQQNGELSRQPFHCFGPCPAPRLQRYYCLLLIRDRAGHASKLEKYILKG